MNFNGITTDWKQVLEAETNQLYWNKLQTIVSQAYKQKYVFPLEEHLFAAFNYFDIKDLKVVILGQDPYHNFNQANGLAFSVDTPKLPPSLKNIFKELKNDLDIDRTNGDLTDWAQQGVLLLNTSLTVIAHEPQSHSKIGWTDFTDDIIKYINKNCEAIIFVLWGNSAIQKTKFIDEKKHYIIKSAHPSPLSARKGFINNNHFSKINNILIDINKQTIKW